MRAAVRWLHDNPLVEVEAVAEGVLIGPVERLTVRLDPDTERSHRPEFRQLEPQPWQRLTAIQHGGVIEPLHLWRR